MQPIAAYDGEMGNPVAEWPPDLTAMYQLKFIQGYALNQAWQEIPPSALVALRDTIRNRILKLALEIKDELGTANDDIHAIPPTKVEQCVGRIKLSLSSALKRALADKFYRAIQARNRRIQCV